MTIAKGTGILVLSYGSRVVRVPPGGRARLGRHASNDIVLGDSAASRFHAEVFLGQDGRIRVVDSGSQNGTFLDGVRVRGEAYATDAAELTLGNCVLALQHLKTADPALIPDASEVVTLFERGGDLRGSFANTRELHRLLLDLEERRETGEIEVCPQAGPPARLAFAAGRVAAARCGELQGLSALERCLGFPSGGYVFQQRFEPWDGTLDASVEAYLKAGIWTTLGVTQRLRPDRHEETDVLEVPGADLDGWLAGESDLHQLLLRVEREEREGSLWLRLEPDTFVLTLRGGQICALHRNARAQQLCLRELSGAAQAGGKYLFAADRLDEAQGESVSPRDLLRELLR